MKKGAIILFLLSACLTTGCNKHHDDSTSQGSVPNVAGMWQGNGTDDTIGYFTVSMTIQQDGDTAIGTYQTVSSFATTSGTIRINLVPTNGGNDVQSIAMARTAWTSQACSASFTLSTPAKMTSSYIGLNYIGTDCTHTGYNGGFNMNKTIAM
jgi:hypothetical protein